MEVSLYNIRHSLAHILASAVLQYDASAKLSVGPVTETGFYYDIDFSPEKNPTPDTLKDLERTMRSLIRKNLTFTRREVSLDEARELFQHNPYKMAILDDLEKSAKPISLYATGEFIDLCEGGHIDNTNTLDDKAFTLTHVAGAYFRGNETGPMLTRIYGLAFETAEELQTHLTQQAEAKKRDHRKIGKELGLFTLSSLVGAGLPMMQPKGMIVRKGISDFLWELHQHIGYSQVWTPHIAKEDLYTTSGHAEKFGDELFRVQGKEEKFIMKPMNCPHHMQLFADNQFSYRDMPIRYFEPATVYRDEKSGQLSGLTRVRAITQDDGHLFCRTTQIEDEVSAIVQVIKTFYTTFDLMDQYWVSLSVRGHDTTGFLGSDTLWQQAEDALDQVAQKNALHYKRIEGEAAFYGPKLDFMFRDAIGREWQLATIQCDFNLPERFDLTFINEQGEKERPVVIHRAIAGSLERFMGILIEHYAGAFPAWLAPVQAIILPIGEQHRAYARDILTLLQKNAIRAEMSAEDESLGKRIRIAKIHKVPYLLVIGNKEVETKSVTLEQRDGETFGVQTQDKALDIILQAIRTKQ
ncbi:MAG: threonine--tRNA ligase [Minisyncoccota bacterium]